MRSSAAKDPYPPQPSRAIPRSLLKQLILSHPRDPETFYTVPMRYILRFLWNATRGHRLAPWRSPYIKWRLETYTGMKMEKIHLWQIIGIMLHEYRQMWRFLLWTAKMDNYARVKPRNPSTQDWG